MSIVDLDCGLWTSIRPTANLHNPTFGLYFVVGLVSLSYHEF